MSSDSLVRVANPASKLSETVFLPLPSAPSSSLSSRPPTDPAPPPSQAPASRAALGFAPPRPGNRTVPPQPSPFTCAAILRRWPQQMLSDGSDDIRAGGRRGGVGGSVPSATALGRAAGRQHQWERQAAVWVPPECAHRELGRAGQRRSSRSTDSWFG